MQLEKSLCFINFDGDLTRISRNNKELNKIAIILPDENLLLSVLEDQMLVCSHNLR